MRRDSQSTNDVSLNDDRGKPRPNLFRALGPNEPPSEISVDGSRYRIQECVKHDSWAATAIYRSVESDEREIVCKFNRQQSIFGFPMKWLGRRLAERESFFLSQLADVENVPAPCQEILVDGVELDNAVAHDFVPGAPLKQAQETSLQFFGELKFVLTTMHKRGFAYVDLHKPENVIVGEDGRPYLIDFQISFRPLQGIIGYLIPYRAFQRMLVKSDEYHLRKLRLQIHRPFIQHETYLKILDRPWWIKGHRMFAEPFRQLRRRLLVALRIRREKGFADTEHDPEIAVRLRVADVPLQETADEDSTPIQERYAA